MKINVVHLGGGLTRLGITPTCVCEPTVIPTHIADDIMRDVVRREKRCGCTCNTEPTRTNSWDRPLPTPNREPDGIDVHVDRPLRSNYGGSPWLADEAFRKDLAKYRNLERAAKQCNWPCKEDMKGVPSAISQHNPTPRTQFVGVPTPQSRPTPCWDEKSELRKAIGALAAIVERM